MASVASEEGMILDLQFVLSFFALIFPLPLGDFNSSSPR